jgi:hypothetical protein
MNHIKKRTWSRRDDQLSAMALLVGWRCLFRYDIIVRDIATFLCVYLSLYAGFALAIYTLDRAYGRYFSAVEASSVPDYEKSGCTVVLLSDVTYTLFTLSFGDNLLGVLTPGRQQPENECGDIQVFTIMPTWDG